MEWCATVRTHLTQVAADRAAVDLTRPPRQDGTARPVAITTAWMLRQDQGRQVLDRTLRGMKTNAFKRWVLQTLAGAFLGNARLCRWKLRATASCDL